MLGKLKDRYKEISGIKTTRLRIYVGLNNNNATNFMKILKGSSSNGKREIDNRV